MRLLHLCRSLYLIFFIVLWANRLSFYRRLKSDTAGVGALISCVGIRCCFWQCGRRWLRCLLEEWNHLNCNNKKEDVRLITRYWLDTNWLHCTNDVDSVTKQGSGGIRKTYSDPMRFTRWGWNSLEVLCFFPLRETAFLFTVGCQTFED